MVRLRVSEKRSITLSTKANLRMIFIMVTGGSSIQMVITTSAIGLTGNDLVMESWLISQVGYTKANGSTVNSWENEDTIRVNGEVSHRLSSY